MARGLYVSVLPARNQISPTPGRCHVAHASSTDDRGQSSMLGPVVNPSESQSGVSRSSFSRLDIWQLMAMTFSSRGFDDEEKSVLLLYNTWMVVLGPLSSVAVQQYRESVDSNKGQECCIFFVETTASNNLWRCALKWEYYGAALSVPPSLDCWIKLPRWYAFVYLSLKPTQLVLARMVRKAD